MKIISWNVNGIRAVERKGDLQVFLETYSPDIVFFQETKASPEQLSDYLTNNSLYHQFYHSAEKKGYSSVAVWISKKISSEPPTVFKGMPNFNDNEGRIIRVDYNDFAFLGVYFPNGGKSHEAWLGKLEFYKLFLKYINQLRSEGKKVIFCGDVNTAHNEIDLARPKENEGKIGFHIDERTWINQLIENKWMDTFRNEFPTIESYTWWDMKTKSRERNIGWRIDYFFAHEALLKNISNNIHIHNQMGSDHCPISIELTI